MKKLREREENDTNHFRFSPPSQLESGESDGAAVIKEKRGELQTLNIQFLISVCGYGPLAHLLNCILSGLIRSYKECCCSHIHSFL